MSGKHEGMEEYILPKPIPIPCVSQDESLKSQDDYRVVREK